MQLGPECSLPESSERQYNFIYERLVSEPDDAIGLVAYGLYKRKKIEHIEQFKKKNGGRGPCEKELATFHEVSCQHVDEYRNSAEELMAQAFEAVSQEYLIEAQKKYEEELKERLKGSFWSNVGASVVGAFVVALAVGMLLVILVGIQGGWEAIIRTLLEVASK